MPEKGNNSYQNISQARSESSHENKICCSCHLNDNVLKKQRNSLTKHFTLQRPVPP